MIGGHDPGGDNRNRRLGDFLRSRRAKIAAHRDASGTQRRRTKGLRREEVAQLAGISTEWYVKIEQGRDASPSHATLVGIARALRLDDGERSHLLALAGWHPPASPCGDAVSETLVTIVEGLDQPAYLTNRCWDLLAWNGAATALLGIDFAAIAPQERNILAWMLLDPGARALFGNGWEEEARRMVSLFRTTCDLHGDDPALQDRLARLRQASAPFEQWWQKHEIGASRSGVKQLHHPTDGDITMLFSTFQANDDPGLKLALYRRIV